MSDNELTLDDEEVNVEEIMQKIRERIADRKKEYTKEFIDPSDVSIDYQAADYNTLPSGEGGLETNLYYVNTNCQKKSTINRVLGKLPIIRAITAGSDIQLEFNTNLVRVLNKLFDNQKQLLEKPTIDSLDDTYQINYLEFEHRFRGKYGDIKKQQSQFLKYYNGCKNVLDIGCGRGEFLNFLVESGVGCYGLDINTDLIDYAKQNGLTVINSDALSHLLTLKDESLDGIFMSHVVEHIEPYELLAVLKQSYQKLQKGKYIIISTPNPRSLSIFYNSFYMDLTHTKPLHPYTLDFILKGIGFSEVKTKYMYPVPAEMALKRLKDTAGNKIMNDNIDKLNEVLFGPQDYSIIAKK